MARPTSGYRNAAGAKVPGTTTIIGRYKDSAGLIQWAYKQGREHENLAMRDLPSPAHLYDVVDAAANAGTIAHDMIEASILGKEMPEFDAPADTIAKAINAFDQFRKWKSQTHMEIIATETSYVSERHQFGGTIDGVGRDSDGNIVLIDWKTSNSVYSDYLVQLAAYSLLLEECQPEFAPTGFHLLRVAKESADFAHHYWGELDDAKEAFLLMRQLYRLDHVLKQRAR